MTVILFLVVLSILVLAHEAGHFFAARRMGIGVEEFGFGFPPRAFSIKRKGILYSINWIPLGGFVKLKGESGESDASDAFSKKSLPRRLLVLSAGVLMNVLLAIVLFTVCYGIGMPEDVSGALPYGARVTDQKMYAMSVLTGSPAESAGLKAGDQIVDIAGTPVVSSQTFRDTIAQNVDKEVVLSVKRDNKIEEVKVTPRLMKDVDRPVIGVGLYEQGTVSYPWYLAPVQGARLTFTSGEQIIVAFGGLFKSLFTTGKPGVDISGPVGIAVLTGKVAALGPIYFLEFIALLSVNLAILNILPIPALDGGRVLFLAIEKIRGRAVSSHIEDRVHQIGFLLLMVLVFVITFHDITNLFHK